MPRWRLLLGGPLVWAIHFGAIYAVTSVSFIAAGATTLLARGVIFAISALCMLTCVWIAITALRKPRGDGLVVFWRNVAVTGAILAAIAVVWQTLPVFADLEGTAPSRPS